MQSFTYRIAGGLLKTDGFVYFKAGETPAECKYFDTFDDFTRWVSTRASYPEIRRCIAAYKRYYKTRAPLDFRKYLADFEFCRARSYLCTTSPAFGQAWNHLPTREHLKKLAAEFHPQPECPSGLLFIASSDTMRQIRLYFLNWAIANGK